MSTVWWILWTIGIINTYIGVVFSLNSDRKDALMGWMLTTIGFAFNGFVYIVHTHWIMTIVNFGMAYASYRIFKREQKEFDKKELGIKEKFLRDLSDYKFKLDRKKHKIV